MTLGALRRRARAVGVGAELLDDADDTDDPEVNKRAVVNLILSQALDSAAGYASNHCNIFHPNSCGRFHTHTRAHANISISLWRCCVPIVLKLRMTGLRVWTEAHSSSR